MWYIMQCSRAVGSRWLINVINWDPQIQRKVGHCYLSMRWLQRRIEWPLDWAHDVTSVSLRTWPLNFDLQSTTPAAYNVHMSVWYRLAIASRHAMPLNVTVYCYTYSGTHLRVATITAIVGLIIVAYFEAVKSKCKCLSRNVSFRRKS